MQPRRGFCEAEAAINQKSFRRPFSKGRRGLGGGAHEPRPQSRNSPGAGRAGTLRFNAKRSAGRGEKTVRWTVFSRGDPRRGSPRRGALGASQHGKGHGENPAGGWPRFAELCSANKKPSENFYHKPAPCSPCIFQNTCYNNRKRRRANNSPR